VAAAGSISAAHSGADSRMRVGVPGTSVSRVSDSEWAGSVDSTSVGVPSRALARAVAAAQVVFPTPPFPP